MEFGAVRNTIIHDRKLPPLEYSISDTAYSGHFFFTPSSYCAALSKYYLRNAAMKLPGDPRRGGSFRPFWRKRMQDRRTKTFMIVADAHPAPCNCQ